MRLLGKVNSSPFLRKTRALQKNMLLTLCLRNGVGKWIGAGGETSVLVLKELRAVRDSEITHAGDYLFPRRLVERAARAN
jgi:hypothetical protein